MYIELFLLDNAIMNFLILRLAGAICSVRIRMRRMLLFAVMGAFLAWLALFFPVLTTLPFKLVTGLLFALAIPFRNGKGYMSAAASTFLSAFLTGGLTVCFALALGGEMEQGFLLASIPLRIALVSAVVVSFLPNAVRRLLLRRAVAGQTTMVTLRVGGREYMLHALVDTGNLLHEPVSGLPVAIAYLPELREMAKVPIPASTATGESILFALKPDRIADRQHPQLEMTLLVALSENPIEGADIILPAVAIPN